MVEKINERARHSTELINLVQLQRQFQNLASNDKSSDQRAPRLQSEAQTQTDTHIKVGLGEGDYTGGDPYKVGNLAAYKARHLAAYKARHLAAYKAGHLAAYKAKHPSIWVCQ